MPARECCSCTGLCALPSPGCLTCGGLQPPAAAQRPGALSRHSAGASSQRQTPRSAAGSCPGCAAPGPCVQRVSARCPAAWPGCFQQQQQRQQQQQQQQQLAWSYLQRCCSATCACQAENADAAARLRRRCTAFSRQPASCTWVPECTPHVSLGCRPSSPGRRRNHVKPCMAGSGQQWSRPQPGLKSAVCWQNHTALEAASLLPGLACVSAPCGHGAPQAAPLQRQQELAQRAALGDAPPGDLRPAGKGPRLHASKPVSMLSSTGTRRAGLFGHATGMQRGRRLAWLRARPPGGCAAGAAAAAWPWRRGPCASHAPAPTQPTPWPAGACWHGTLQPPRPPAP